MIGVYIARDADGGVLYVGSSGDIDKRLREHSTQSAWWPEATNIERIEVANRALAYHRERELIAELHPPRNQMSTKPPKAKSRDLGPAIRPRPEAMAGLIEAFGSVAALARSVGVDHMTMSDIWRDVHYPSSKVVARLIVVTGIPFDELFYVDATDTPAESWLSRRAPRRSKSAVA